jgi:hypothetical protein
MTGNEKVLPCPFCGANYIFKNTPTGSTWIHTPIVDSNDCIDRNKILYADFQIKLHNTRQHSDGLSSTQTAELKEAFTAFELTCNENTIPMLSQAVWIDGAGKLLMHIKHTLYGE